MNTRIPVFLSAVALMAPASAQLQRIVVQGSGQPQVYTSINAALAAAQPNDKLYLSGGVFSENAHISFDKPLHLIGAGHGPDSSAVTSTTTLATTNGFKINILTTASGSTYTGIRFSPDQNFDFGIDNSNDDPTGLLFERCTFDAQVDVCQNNGPGSSSSVFNECIFHSYLLGQAGTTVLLTHCVLDYLPGTGATVSGFDGGALTMRHCIALGANVGNSDGSTIENSIFTKPTAPFWQSNGAILTNNLLVSPNLVSNMTPGPAVGNVLGVASDSIFVDEDNDDLEWTDDVHLQPTCVGVGMATDGTDVGVYGTATPWKEGGAPFNPHFRAAAIAPATNANGDLPVNIRVAAQPN